MQADRIVRSTCPYCGVGCQVDLHLHDEQIFHVGAPFDHPVNHGNLCVKGRFGYDFVHHKSRVRTPLIRRNGTFVEATWDEALDYVADRLAEVRTQHGPDAIAGFCSAKATNEDNYLFQKLFRAVLGTNSIDHCARLCHAGSVTGLQMAIGSAAMSNSIREMRQLDCFIVTGSNTAETHPVISLELKAAVEQDGATLIVADPRRIEMADFATLWLRQTPGTDVALFSAMANVIVEEGLYNEAFIGERTEGFEAFKQGIVESTPEWAEEITGVPAEDIVKAARMYATADRGAIYWGMGISQSTHGTDNTLTLANLALLCGHVGRPGTGLNPLRGQNNVQGCSDSGGLPNVYPGYQSVADDEVRAKFEAAWGRSLDPDPGLTVTEIVDAAGTGKLRALFVMGENPLMTEPNLRHAEECLDNLELLVCQDIFINETGERADVILPAASFAEKEGTFTNSDRRVQRVRKAIEPVGQSRPDWEILCDLARRLEARLGQTPSAGWEYTEPSEIWDEMASLTPSFAGINYGRIGEVGVHWPCPSEDHPGTPWLFEESFPRGLGKFHLVSYRESVELPDEEYPYILSTGRVLYHWHGGTLTRRSKLDEIFPEALVEVHPEDAETIGCTSGDWLRVRSRRGQIEARALVTGRSPVGTVFIPFHFVEAAANELTNEAIDPLAKIPDYKVCAVRVEMT